MPKRDQIYKITINGKHIRPTDAEGLGKALNQVLVSSNIEAAVIGCVPWEYAQRVDELDRIRVTKVFNIQGPKHPNNDFIAFFRTAPKNTMDVKIIELVSGNEDEISRSLSQETGVEVILEPFSQWSDTKTREKAADIRTENFSKAYDYTLIATTIIALLDIFYGFYTAAIPVIIVGICWLTNHKPLTDLAIRGRGNAFLTAGLTLGSPWSAPLNDTTRFIRSIGRTASMDKRTGLLTLAILLFAVTVAVYFAFLALTIPPSSTTSLFG